MPRAQFAEYEAALQGSNDRVSGMDVPVDSRVIIVHLLVSQCFC